MTGPDMAALGVATAGLAITGASLMNKDHLPDRWYDLVWPRDVPHDDALGLLRTLASDRRRYVIALEAIATGGKVRYRIGLNERHVHDVMAAFRSFIPGVHLKLIELDRTAMPLLASQLHLTSSHRSLNVGQIDQTIRAVLTTMAATQSNETIILQWLLGPRLPGLAVKARGVSEPVSTLRSAARAALTGPREMDSEARRALRDKVAEPGFRASARIGVAASDPLTTKALLGRMIGALRVAEGPGVRLQLKADDPMLVAEAKRPKRWPVAVNIAELAMLSGWPLGERELPGIAKARSRVLPPGPTIPDHGRVIGEATYPGMERPLALQPTDALQHLHVLGPTGVGKSTLLLNLALEDIRAGRGVVVIDPKGDLVEDVLRRVPPERLDDVVVIDPADESRPVGINPLASRAGSDELVADQVLAVFHGLYRDNWGPRTQDILHASLLTLAGRPNVTLCALPVLLSNHRYRQRLVSGLTDEVALKPFWSWFESLSDGERQQAIAPVMNKLRAFLLRPRMRAVIGQSQPAFQIEDVFTKKRIVLVSLAKGLLGPEASALLGSLVVSQLWQAALGRVAIPQARRSPVMVYIDEFQDYLHLPTDLADVLTQARGLGLGLTLAHQHLAQLPTSMRSAVLANARSRVCFQMTSEDASTFARLSRDLEPEDFQSLPRFTTYASLVADGSPEAFVSMRTREPIEPVNSAEDVRARSRLTFGRDLAEIEDELASLVGGSEADDQPVGRRRRT